jgi:hypothetical protein
MVARGKRLSLVKATRAPLESAAGNAAYPEGL